jgi:hypothetical protein
MVVSCKRAHTQNLQTLHEFPFKFFLEVYMHAVILASNRYFSCVAKNLEVESL